MININKIMIVKKFKVYRIKQLLKKTDRKMSRQIDDLISFALKFIDINKPNLQFPKKSLELYYYREQKRKELRRIQNE